MGKRFLLVMDDVWSEKIEDWETLVGPFLAAAPGSKIIITTRKQQLLNKLGYGQPYNLNKLSHDDALSLFAQHALGVNNFDTHPQLLPYGERIVQKCDGLPLALRALGSLLRTKTDEEEWKELLNDEIWGLEDGGGIVPALRLSYQDLSACLKQLFAYCSLLPKDYMFKKEELILLWMAEGFFQKSTSNKSMERLEIDEVPESVGSLKHMRQLTKLPDNFLKLKNLRHFDIRYTCLWNMMPLGTCELNSLQTLSNIIVGGNNDFLISGLKNIKDLQGKIYIRELDKFQSARDIQEVNLSKKRVSELHVEWSDVFDDSRNDTLEKDVLNALKPHSNNLKDLEIVWYGGKLFPNWIGDPSFICLTCISIRSCRNCTFLPPLGKLPLLKKLSIERMNEVKVIGSELLGTNPAFPSLEILSFHDMRGWEVWSANDGVIGATAFPCLKELSVHDCPNLAKVSLEALPSLKILKIKSCSDGVLRSLIHVASSVTNLSIYGIFGLTDEVWSDVMGYLREVDEINIEMCNEIRYLW
ncbi:Disease resistance protein [Artemisia annua]|uniref:Disease resistance protein n=1 Tax=Artemisia annua TaxID=35608 RepID=A0A2U1N6N3_ARTAN|nr:Disease resistance protein [Artemisia annua]